LEKKMIVKCSKTDRFKECEDCPNRERNVCDGSSLTEMEFRCPRIPYLGGDENYIRFIEK
jgi:hypothetical protein